MPLGTLAMGHAQLNSKLAAIQSLLAQAVDAESQLSLEAGHMENESREIYIDLACDFGEALDSADPGDKITWNNRTENCEITLIPPSCVSPKKTSVITAGGSSIVYTVNNSKGAFLYWYYCDCDIEPTRIVPYSLRTGVINVN